MYHDIHFWLGAETTKVNTINIFINDKKKKVLIILKLG